MIWTETLLGTLGSWLTLYVALFWFTNVDKIAKACPKSAIALW